MTSLVLTTPFDAIILAGGRAQRLGGVDKSALRLNGTSLLRLALDSVSNATLRIVVGNQSPAELPLGVVVTRESPPWSGPAAALLAGIAALASRIHSVDSARSVIVLACDLVSADLAVARLAEAMPLLRGSDGLVAVDNDGRRQPLLGIYRLSSLLHLATDGTDASGQSLHALLDPLALREVPLPTRFCADVDTPADAASHNIDLPMTAPDERNPRG